MMNTPPPSLLSLCQFQEIKWEKTFLYQESKYHKLGLWPHNDNCIVPSLSKFIRRQNIDLTMW